MLCCVLEMHSGVRSLCHVFELRCVVSCVCGVLRRAIGSLYALLFVRDAQWCVFTVSGMCAAFCCIVRVRCVASCNWWALRCLLRLICTVMLRSFERCYAVVCALPVPQYTVL